MSDTDFLKYSPPQNPFNQPFTLLLPDGTPFNVTTGDLASFHYYTVKLAINRGVMIGACIIMLICLLVLTKRDKRGSPIFIINLLALLLTAIRQILVAIFLAGPFQHPYAVVAGDFDHITSIDKSNSIAVPVLATITLAIILISLLMQVKVVAATMQRTHRMALLGFCSVFALVAIGFQFALMVINCKAIIALESIYGAWFVRLQKETYASLVATLLLFTLIFVTKLGFAIRKRHQLGLRRFGPMQVIFIMGVQTLIVPTVIASLQFDQALPEMYSWFLTLIVLSLPLSSLWASASLDGSNSYASSRANVDGYSSSKSHDKSLTMQKSNASFSHKSSALETKVMVDKDVEAAPSGIVSKKTWNVSRSEA